MTELPDRLLEALRITGTPTAIAMGINDRFGVFVVVDAATIYSCNRPGVQVQFQPQLALYPEAAVFRLHTRIYDRPGSPLAFESFLNVADEYDLPLLTKLSRQRSIDFYFHDEAEVFGAGGYVFTKKNQVEPGDCWRLAAHDSHSREAQCRAGRGGLSDGT